VAPPHPHTDVLADLTLRLRRAGCVFAEDEAALIAATARTPRERDLMARRRCAGLPLQHVLGWARFCGLRLRVDPGVFVPRPRSEFLARQASALAPPTGVAVDLCCGTGALGAVLARDHPRLTLHAADIDPAAAACARHNLPRAHVHQGDLFAALPADLAHRVDVLVANVPYVPSGHIELLPPEARDHEDHRALDGGADGLDLVRRVSAHAPAWLSPGGHLLVEVGRDQVGAARAAFEHAGLTCRVRRCPEQDATVVTGTR
jgi:release factor glutamine methyltransferase